VRGCDCELQRTRTLAPRGRSFEATNESSGAVEIVAEAAAQGTTTHSTGAGTYTTSGTLLSVARTCGIASASSGPENAAPYTASGDVLLLFDDGKAACSPVVATFHKL
jgi:hypothetical protein